MNPVHLEWLGAAFGLSGSFLLASTTRHSRYAWWLFAVSNVSLAAFAAIHSYFGLLLLNQRRQRYQGCPIGISGVGQHQPAARAPDER